MSTVWSLFANGLISPNFFSILIVSHQFFTLIAPGDVDLCFSLILVRKTNFVEEETRWPMWLYQWHNQFTHV